MKRKILIITGIFPPDIGGPASYVPKMAQYLLDDGWSVTVVTLSDQVAGSGKANQEYKVLRVRRSLFLPLRWVATIFVMLRHGMGAPVWYVNGLPFEAFIASTLLGKRTVHKIVGDYAWERAQNRGLFSGTIDAFQTAKKGLVLRTLGWLRTTPLRFSRRIIVPSDYLRSIVHGWGIPLSRIVTVYNAVDPLPPLTPLALPEFGGKTLLTVCRLTPWKGVDGILSLLPSRPQWRLLVAGDGPERSALEKIAATLGVANRVVFLGSIPRDKIAAAFAQADAFVLNSTYEGLPHVVLEAMQARVPVVATNVGGTSEVVQHRESGLLVRAEHADELRAAIDSVTTDAALAQILTQAASRQLAKWGVESMLDGAKREILTIY